MGDMLTLIEQAEQHFEADQAEAMAAKMAGNDFTLEDFLQQMMMLRKMGPIGGLLGMLPGAGQMKEALANVDDRDIDRTAAIIQSMTPAERAEPKIINASRRQRIARGSGSTVAQVNALVDRFFEARKMMSSMAGRFGLPGARPSNRKNAKGRKGKRDDRSRPDAAEGQGHARRVPRDGRNCHPGMGGDRRNGSAAGRRRRAGSDSTNCRPGSTRRSSSSPRSSVRRAPTSMLIMTNADRHADDTPKSEQLRHDQLPRAGGRPGDRRPGRPVDQRRRTSSRVRSPMRSS